MTETMYEKLGISKEVYEFGQTIEAGSTGNLRTNQCRFCMECTGVYLLQCVSSHIVVAIPAGVVETPLTDLIFLHGMEHL